ncbi:uncharacterized protein LOC116341769 [Contarinia nasturtii]|uniref:uncharacterized protein LOC116341769 n=1 Tax=Contarinia nasturtii TaxID=265458 RepID=UPI0012D410E6|nr:uncharacterized protein LOC116341769 [Contarinia nasturtii]
MTSLFVAVFSILAIVIVSEAGDTPTPTTTCKWTQYPVNGYKDLAKALKKYLCDLFHEDFKVKIIIAVQCSIPDYNQIRVYFILKRKGQKDRLYYADLEIGITGKLVVKNVDDLGPYEYPGKSSSSSSSSEGCKC